MDTMNDTIYNMLAEVKPEFDFTDSENFIEDGLLDSFDIIVLCGMLEEHFKIEIDGLDIVPENFFSVDAIAELAEKSPRK